MDQRTVGRAIAIALAVAAAAGLAVGYKRHGSSGGGKRSAGGPPGEPWSCECGQAYRVAGEGRHRVYWLVDAPEADPVMGSTCVNCERPLPAGAEHP